MESKRTQAGNLGERAKWGLGRLATPKEISHVRKLAANGCSVREISSRVSLSKSQVQRILSRK